MNAAKALLVQAVIFWAIGVFVFLSHARPMGDWLVTGAVFYAASGIARVIEGRRL